MVRFLKFGIVGVMNTLITFASYSLLVYLGVNYMVSNVIGYALGILNSYFWNKGWVFKKKDADSKTVMKFIVVNLITLGFNTGFLYILVDNLYVNKYLAQIGATALGLIINYTLNKIWTFKE